MPASAFIDQHPLIKCTLVGDVAVGKSTLIGRYSQLIGNSPDDQQRQLLTSFDGHKTLFVDLDIDVESVENRPAQFSNTDAVLVCVSVADASRVETSLEQLLAHVRKDFPGIPFLLVGTQIDYRCCTPQQQPVELNSDFDKVQSPVDDVTHRPLAAQRAEQLARKIGAVRYVECSARTGEGVDDVFEDAYKVALAFVESCKEKRGGKKDTATDKKRHRPSCITQ